MPSRVYTIETRIPGSSKVVDYLNTYVTEYPALTRRMWHDMTSPDFKERFPAMSRYVTYICRKYGLLKRTVNSIRFDVQGRMKSLMELKKTELLQTDIKINSCGDRIKSIKSQLDMLKQKAAANSLGDRELEKYQNLKQSLYWQKNRLNRLKQRKAGLEYQIREKVYDMCYGSKGMFRRQHRLMENGYKTHEKWHNDFIRSRDRNIFYLGSSDESFGNQMCRLKYNSQTGFFTLELRKEYKYCTDKKACSKADQNWNRQGTGYRRADNRRTPPELTGTVSEDGFPLRLQFVLDSGIQQHADHIPTVLAFLQVFFHHVAAFFTAGPVGVQRKQISNHITFVFHLFSILSCNLSLAR